MSQPSVCAEIESPAVSRDFRAELKTLSEEVCRNPNDSECVGRLMRAAEAWIDAAGLPPLTQAQQTVRPRLAEWLAPLAGTGRIVHFGAGDGSVGAALASGGAEVVSHLEHTARAVAAAVRFARPTLEFSTLDAASFDASQLADLVVVETDGFRPALPLREALGALRAGGWLAVLGAPVIVTADGLVEAGIFRIDGASRVHPLPHADGGEQVALLRFAGSSGARVRSAPAAEPGRRQAQDDVPPLTRLTRSRHDRSEAERALERRAAAFRTLPIPDQALIDWVGGGTPATYHQIGLINAHNLTVYCGLTPQHRVLEPGCGCGRNARWIVPYLDPEEGRFAGFDISEQAIAYARREIASRYTNARFDFADIRNTAYNPNGSQQDTDYVFPYESASFDIVFLPSVFTHMTRGGFEHYAREIHRVLKPGGRLLAWHFLLNRVSYHNVEQGKSSIPMTRYDAVSWAKFLDNPSAAVAFDEAYVLEFYEALGLRAQAVMYGEWSGREATGFKDYQDRVLALKHA